MGNNPFRFLSRTCLSLCLAMAMLGVAPATPFAAAISDGEFFLKSTWPSSITGDFMLTSASRIIVVGDVDEKLEENGKTDGKGDLAALLDEPRGWAQKLRYATGFELEIVSNVSDGKASDIVLRRVPVDSVDFIAPGYGMFVVANPSDPNSTKKKITKNYKQEGYLFSANATGLTITYAKTLGGFRGFQTATLMVMNDDDKAVGTHRTIQGINGFDYPQYENRRIMLDVARQFVPVDQLIGYMDKMSMHKLNELHLHLNDSTAPELGGAKNGYFRLYNESKPRELLIPADQPIKDGKPDFAAGKTVYDSKDWANLEKAAYRYGIKLVPEFDAPGHASAFKDDGAGSLQYAPVDRLTLLSKPWAISDSILTNDVGDRWTPSKNLENTVTYFESLIRDFRPWFKSDTIHIGGDEADPNKYPDTIKYINTLYDRIKKTPQNKDGFTHVWMWDDGIHMVNGMPGLYQGANSEIGIVRWQDWFDKSFLQIKNRPESKWIDAEGTEFYYTPRNFLPNNYTSIGKTSPEIYNSYLRRLALYSSIGTIPNGIQYTQWSHLAGFPGNQINPDYINAGLSKTFPGIGYFTWHGADDIPNPVVQIVGLTPSRIFRPYDYIYIERLINVSQEMSAFWVHERLKKSVAEAKDVLMKASKHRELYREFFGPVPGDIRETTNADTDWMGWDVSDMALAFTAADAEAK